MLDPILIPLAIASYIAAVIGVFMILIWDLNRDEHFRRNLKRNRHFYFYIGCCVVVSLGWIVTVPAFLLLKGIRELPRRFR